MSAKYSKPVVLLHWIEALLLSFLLLGGTFVLSNIPNTLEKLSAFKIHMIVGVVVLVLTIIRIVFVSKSTKVEPMPMSEMRAKIVSIHHKLIYIVTLLTALSGMALAKMSSLGEIVFFGSQVALYESFKDFPIGIVHGMLSKVLLFLVVTHILGVIAYMIKYKTNIFKRVSF
jgi:cytochrome b561